MHERPKSRTMNVSFDDLHLFSQTVVHGGISAAAQANQLQRSKVSRRLQELEKALGCPLLIRTTRTIELTEHGKRLFELVGQPIEHIQQGLNVMHEYQQELTGKVRVAIPSALMSSAAFNWIINEYTTRYPEMSVEIENHQESVDLKRQAFDLQLLPSVVKCLMTVTFNSACCHIVATSLHLKLTLKRIHHCKVWKI